MKHILQWKFIVIMFISVLCGVAAMACSQAVIFENIIGMTAEEAEIAAEKYTFLFNILFMIVTIGVFLLLSRKIIKRIELMSKNVAQIAAGNVETLAADSHKDELGSLSRNINEMAYKISGSLEKEREMVCNVAHDLRTPVTSIQGYAKLLNKNADLSEEDRKYVSIIESKSVALSEQINELLEYSVLQFEEKEYTFEKLSLTQLLEQVLVEFIPQLEQEHMTFSFTGNQFSCNVNCNQILMVRLLENLLNNSIRYGKTGKRIELAASESESECIIEISNYGISLTKEEREHLFDAFYQGKEANNYQTESKGLGLAIVSKIVTIHNGDICVNSVNSVDRVNSGVDPDTDNDCNNQAGKITFKLRFPKS